MLAVGGSSEIAELASFKGDIVEISPSGRQMQDSVHGTSRGMASYGTAVGNHAPDLASPSPNTFTSREYRW
jgi:hypothetical protein